MKVDHVAVEGKNGSGKSTLLKILTGLYLDYEGHIYINNCELKNLDINWIRENINVVNQNPFIFNSTVFDNIKYCCLSSMDEEIDEHDNALDVFSKEKIIDILSQSEKTIIVISHNSEWKSRFSNEIISL